MKKDFVEIQAIYDFILDQFESRDHLDDICLDDIHQTVNDNLEDFLAIGCEPAKLASMMDPVDVLTRVELFKGIDVNPVAKRLDYIDFEVFFKQLVELGVKAASIRNLVAEWDGETIVNHLADLRKCGFSKKALANLLYKKIGEYGPSFDSEEYLDVVCMSEHLYAFLSRECLEYAGDGKFYAGYYEDSLPFDVAALVDHGADKKVISEWIANQMVQHIFDADLYEELQKYDVFPSEEQIIGSLDMWNDDSIYEWMHYDGPNPLFMAFMNNSENPRRLISKLDDLSENSITEYPCTAGGPAKDYLMKYRNVWKVVFTLVVENSCDELDTVVALGYLQEIELEEAEWREILSGRKEQLEECIAKFKGDSDYDEDMNLLNRIVAFAS